MIIQLLSIRARTSVQFRLMVRMCNIFRGMAAPLRIVLPEPVLKLAEATANSPSVAASPTPSPAKDAFGVTLRFTQTLMKRLPDIVDGNPVKMALSLAKAIIQIKDVRALT
jgi:hypothetical protein